MYKPFLIMSSQTILLSNWRKNYAPLTTLSSTFINNSIFSFGNSTADVASILSNLAARFTSTAQVTQLETFYNGKELEFGSQTIPTAIADAKFNLEWANTHVPGIYDYMRGVSGASQLVSSISLLLIVSAVGSLLFK